MKKRYAIVKETGRKIELYQRPLTGRLVPCPGEAHSNPFIDNCGTCMPRWGEVDEEGPIDIEAAKKANLAMPFLRDLDEARVRELGGKLVGVVEKRRGCTAYFNVFVWEKTK